MKFLFVQLLFLHQNFPTEAISIHGGNWTIKGNDKFVKFTHISPNGTQEGSLTADVFQNLGHPNVEIAAIMNSNEFFRQSFSYCTFANPKGVKMIVNMFFTEINKIINPEILTCPVKKGVYRACDFSKFENVKFDKIPVLPFMKLGQIVDFTITIRSVINRRKEFLCSVLLRHYISN